MRNSKPIVATVGSAATVATAVSDAAAMAEAVTGHTDVAINRDHKPGGSGTVGMTAYMAAPADGYNVLEHIDDALMYVYIYHRRIQQSIHTQHSYISYITSVYYIRVVHY